MPTPDADEGTEIESSTCYNGVLSRVYNRLKVNHTAACSKREPDGASNQMFSVEQIFGVHTG